MPKYKFGNQTFRRKNLYIPCVIAQKFDDLPPEKKVEVFKKTWWCDLLTKTEWATILDYKKVDYEHVVKSRLKKKVAGWLIALARLSLFDSKLFEEAVELAKKTYEELCFQPYPTFNVVSPICKFGGEKP